MNRKLYKGRYTIPVEEFEKFDSLCNLHDYHIEPNDGDHHRIMDKRNPSLSTASMMLELQDSEKWLLTVLYTRQEVDPFAEFAYHNCSVLFISSL